MRKTTGLFFQTASTTLDEKLKIATYLSTLKAAITAGHRMLPLFDIAFILGVFQEIPLSQKMKFAALAKVLFEQFLPTQFKFARDLYNVSSLLPVTKTQLETAIALFSMPLTSGSSLGSEELSKVAVFCDLQKKTASEIEENLYIKACELFPADHERIKFTNAHYVNLSNSLIKEQVLPSLIAFLKEFLHPEKRSKADTYTADNFDSWRSHINLNALNAFIQKINGVDKPEQVATGPSAARTGR